MNCFDGQMDRLTMQAAMSGNLEAQRRVFGVSRNKSQKLAAQMVMAPRKIGGLPVALQAILDTDQQIIEVEFNRRMRAATQKEFK